MVQDHALKTQARRIQKIRKISYTQARAFAQELSPHTRGQDFSHSHHRLIAFIPRILAMGRNVTLGSRVPKVGMTSMLYAAMRAWKEENTALVVFEQDGFMGEEAKNFTILTGEEFAKLERPWETFAHVAFDGYREGLPPEQVQALAAYGRRRAFVASSRDDASGRSLSALGDTHSFVGQQGAFRGLLYPLEWRDNPQEFKLHEIGLAYSWFPTAEKAEQLFFPTEL